MATVVVDVTFVVDALVFVEALALAAVVLAALLAVVFVALFVAVEALVLLLLLTLVVDFLDTGAFFFVTTVLATFGADLDAAVFLAALAGVFFVLVVLAVIRARGRSLLDAGLPVALVVAFLCFPFVA